MSGSGRQSSRNKVIEERGVDMLYAAQIFAGEVLTRVDDRADDGETRLVSLGMVDGECFVVVHTERDGAIRLITAWKGGRDERSAYEARLARRDQADAGEG